MKNQNQLSFDLEQIVDAEGMGTILETLAQICFEKSEHIATNYDDKTLAAQWKKDGGKLMKLSGEF